MDIDIEQIVADLRQRIASRAVKNEDDFSESEYLDLYPDVRNAVAAGAYRSGYEHWIQSGRAQGRRGVKRAAGNATRAAAAAGEGTGMPSLRRSSRALDDLRLRAIPLSVFDSIGEPTPLLNTARGRVGHAAMRWMGRAFWWYSYRLKQALESFLSAFNGQQIVQVRALEALQQDLQEIAAAQARQEERIAALGLYTHQTRAELSLQERRLSLLLEEVRKQMRESPEAPAHLAAELSDGSAGLYADFEAAFRGTREQIREKQSIYIPTLRDAGAGQHDRPVVDLGCGRGEWLELLRAEQMVASGVDSNESMIETCRGLGLNAVRGDALSHLHGLQDSSVGAVTAFHFVEHLPFDDVLTLIDESIRVLKPDGILILETPNPGNMLVGAQYFYLDPTHIRPLPSPMLRFFVEARGMCRAEIRELHPYPESLRVPEAGSEIAKRFNDYFYGPRDYAVVARRP